MSLFSRLIQKNRSNNYFLRNLEIKSFFFKENFSTLNFIPSNNQKIECNTLRKVVLVEGVRTPFQLSCSNFKTFDCYDLARISIANLIKKIQLDKTLVDLVVLGNTIQEPKTSNVAREASLAALSSKVPSFTISSACISSDIAINEAVQAISLGNANVALAGGTDTMSDFPIRLAKSLRSKLIEAKKNKRLIDWLEWIIKLRISDFSLENINVAEYSTGEELGHAADRLCSSFDISRRDSDEYALRSHELALEANKKEKLIDRIPIYVPLLKRFIAEDNGIRVTSMQQLSNLKLAFSPSHGTVTAGNSSFFTDGASVSLLMAEETALELGFKPKVYISQFTLAATDPANQLLLGPAYSIPKLLKKTKLNLQDIDVFELHEAFSGQILSCLKALDSEYFCQSQLFIPKVGVIPLEKLNLWGGSLSLGHPFGATGSRLLNTAANRLLEENGNYGLIASCSAGGQASATLIQRYPAS